MEHKNTFQKNVRTQPTFLQKRNKIKDMDAYNKSIEDEIKEFEEQLNTNRKGSTTTGETLSAI